MSGLTQAGLGVVQSDFVRWLDVDDTAVVQWIGPRAMEGLAVYQNNYRWALMDCLKDAFPQLHSWLGDEHFELAARGFVQHHPSTSWTLDIYGSGFAEWLAALYPDDHEVAELAALEWALGRSFVGADAFPLTADRLGMIDWDNARMTFVPTLQHYPVATNAGAIWLALAAEEPPPQPSNLAQPAHMLVWRQGLTPSFRTFDPEEHRSLEMALAGSSFGAICTALVADHGDDQGTAIAGACLGQWLRDGLIAAVDAEGGD